MEAAKIDGEFCLEIYNGNLRLKRSHAYYAQVMGQMALCGVKWCDFVVYTAKGMHIERVPYDGNMWHTMLDNLERLYLDKFLPKYLEITE